MALTLAARAALTAVGAGSLFATELWKGPRTLIGMWARWDAPHYLELAVRGYVKEGEGALFIVFFPLYPVLVAVVRVAVRDLVLSGLLVSAAATAAAALLLSALVRHDGDDAEARRAVLLLFAFPTAYFLSAPYTEATFLCAVLATALAARKGRFVLAGLAGAAATATRLVGVAVLPLIAVEAVRQRRGRCGAGSLAIASTGFGAYLAVNVVTHGSPVAFLRVQSEHWYQRVVPPWSPISEAAGRLLDATTSGDYTFIYATRIAAAAFAAGVLVAAARRLRPADQVYAWSGLVLVLSSSWLLSLPRYVLALYPIVVALAKLLRGRWAMRAAVATGAVMQAALFSRYVRGSWAF